MNATISDKTGARIVVPVALEGRGYDIHIGRHQLCEAAALIAAFAPGAKAALVTDESVAALHGAAFESCLHQEGITTTRITIPPGEASKSYAQFVAPVSYTHLDVYKRQTLGKGRPSLGPEIAAEGSAPASPSV